MSQKNVTEQRGELTVLPPKRDSYLPSLEVAGWKLSVGQDIRTCPTNIDVTTAVGKAMLFAAGNPHEIRFDKEGKARIRAVYWLLWLEEGVNRETGELVTFTRLAFLDKDGLCYRTTADHGPKRLKNLLDLYSADDWARGIPLVISEYHSQETKRTSHNITVDYASL